MIRHLACAILVIVAIPNAHGQEQCKALQQEQSETLRFHLNQLGPVSQQQSTNETRGTLQDSADQRSAKTIVIQEQSTDETLLGTLQDSADQRSAKTIVIQEQSTDETLLGTLQDSADQRSAKTIVIQELDKQAGAAPAAGQNLKQNLDITLTPQPRARSIIRTPQQLERSVQLDEAARLLLEVEGDSRNLAVETELRRLETPAQVESREGSTVRTRRDLVQETVVEESQLALPSAALQTPIQIEAFEAQQAVTPAAPLVRDELNSDSEFRTENSSKAIVAAPQTPAPKKQVRIQESTTAAATGIQTVKRTRTTRATAGPQTLARKSTRSQRRSKAAGGWWAFLPLLLLLPLVGWLGQKLIGGRRTSESIPKGETRSGNPRSVGSAATVDSLGSQSPGIVDLEIEPAAPTAERAGTSAPAILRLEDEPTIDFGRQNESTYGATRISAESETKSESSREFRTTDARSATSDRESDFGRQNESTYGATRISAESEAEAESSDRDFDLTADLGNESETQRRSEIDLPADRQESRSEQAEETEAQRFLRSFERSEQLSLSAGDRQRETNAESNIVETSRATVETSRETTSGRTASNAQSQCRVESQCSSEEARRDDSNAGWERVERPDTGRIDAEQATTARSGETNPRAGQADDLTRINGIGPATAKLLRHSGITTFGDLFEAGTERLQEILTNGGAKFSMIDPTQWTRQARFCRAGDWTGLARWQSENRPQESNSKSNAEARGEIASSNTRSATRDDLTKIRGIGPAACRVLRQNGVVRFEQVAKMSVQELTDLFADTKSRFQMLDTSTWPAQAEALASGLDSEVELLNEINSIRGITTSSSSSTPVVQPSPNVDV